MKALAQDQLRALSVMTKELDCGLNIGVYDGDTSQKDRAWLRDNARLVNNILYLTVLSDFTRFNLCLNFDWLHTVDHKSRHAAFVYIAIP